MNPALLIPALDLGKTIIDRMFPDPAKKSEAEMELYKLAQSGELQTTLAQLAINAKEAENPSIFVAGWRPFTGWICSFGLLYATVIHNLLKWISVIRGWPLPPAVDTDTLIYVLCALLGIGTLRTVEKVRNVNTK